MLTVETDRSSMEAFYRRYLQHCNDHRFHELSEFVAENVTVNGAAQNWRDYAEGLADVVAVFPDFHWDLQHLLIDGNWLSAHLIDTGTRADGRSIALPEFAVYRLDNGRIAAVWGDLNADRWTTAESSQSQKRD
jgi:predicted ester cyclase